MDSLLTTFILACSSVLLWQTLPSEQSLTFWLVVAFLLYGYRRGFSQYATLTNHAVVCLFGLIWMGSVGHWNRHWQLPPSYYQQTLTVHGFVESLQSQPLENTELTKVQGAVSFILRANRIANQPFVLFKPKLRLSWFDAPWHLQQGQEVRLTVKMKAPRGLANLHSFQVERWLLSEGIDATGYVIPHVDNRWVNQSVSLQQGLLNRISNYSLQNQGWILALALGFRGDLNPTDWQILQKTGTAHLVAISGLHIGMIAVSGYWLCVFFGLLIVRVSGYQNQINLHHLALIVGGLLAFGYAWLAGFSVSTLRAILMLSFVLLVQMLRWHISFRRTLLLTMFSVLLIDPLSVYSLGFWLSFSAVGFIGFALWRFNPASIHSGWKASVWVAIKLQLLLSVLMLPLVAWQWQMVSVSASFANVVAIPLMSFILLPFTLIATFFALIKWPFASALFSYLDNGFAFFIAFLRMIHDIQWGSFQVQSMPFMVWLCAILGGLFWCWPKFPVAKYWASFMFVPLLSHSFNQNASVWQVDVFDVGQGLSVLMSHRQGSQIQASLYDTGMAYESGYSMADAVILPFLENEGIHALDELIISHEDLDHAGGKQTLLRTLVVNRVLEPSGQCVAGERWQRYGADFQVLWPFSKHKMASDNNQSCVVKVDFGAWSMLLTGDIERDAEQALIRAYQDSLHTLRANVLLAPHHGSKTSSSEAFIEAVSPDVVIFSQGYKNQWNMPHPQVMQRYQKRGIQRFQTSETGQIRLYFDDELVIETYRQHWFPYWYLNRD